MERFQNNYIMQRYSVENNIVKFSSINSKEEFPINLFDISHIGVHFHSIKAIY